MMSPESLIASSKVAAVVSDPREIRHLAPDHPVRKLAEWL